MPLYKQDPNNTGKQIPDIQGKNRHDREVHPTSCALTKTPNGVIIGSLTNDVKFFFGSSASYAETVHKKITQLL